jgi:3-oxoacyl-[acyl-carrier protein] reductase
MRRDGGTDMKLQNCIALITGGGSGIGLETARLLKKQGAQVAVCGRRRDVIEAAAKDVGALPLTGDVGREEDAARMVEAVASELGGYNTLINNAGWGRFGMLLDLDVSEMRAILDTNVFGAMLMARESARHFVKAGRGGNIVNVSSTAGSKGFPGGTAYVASKFALGGMTECWRAELRKHDIRVMQVNPSEVQTEFASAAGRQQKLSERKLRSEDIAHAIASILAMHDRGFTTELTVFATNPD